MSKISREIPLETHKETKDHTKIDNGLLWGLIDTDNKERMTDLELEFLEQSNVDGLSNVSGHSDVGVG